MNFQKVICMVAATFAGSLLTITAITPARADQPVVVEGRFDPETQRVVPFRDLNLADPAGRSSLLHRVGYAVDDLCGKSGPTRALADFSAVVHCSKVTWMTAMPQITDAFQQANSGTAVAAAALTITAPR
jgi:UrcA family protein